MTKKDNNDREKVFEEFVFIDTETTGIDEEDRVFQVAYEVSGKEYNEMFLPELPIKIEAMETTGFTNKDVVGKKPFNNSKTQEHLKTIFEKEEKIFIAHNAKFDIKMLAKDGVETKRFIDTLKIAQFLDTKGHFNAYRLQYLRYALDLDVKNAQAHDALGDIRVLKALFIRLFDKMLKTLKSEEEVVKKMMEISMQPILIKKFVFGKYKGDPVSEVASKDKGYLEWLLKQKETQASEGDVDEDWLFTLKKYLNK